MKSLNLCRRALGVLAALLATSSAGALQITLDPNQTAVYDFDASALIPYQGAFAEVQGPAMNGFRLELWTGYGASGTLVNSCSVEVFCLFYEFDAGLTDGDFSISLTNLGALTPLGPDTATYTVAAGALGPFISRLYLDPIVSVPEPGTLALLFMGLASLGLSNRRGKRQASKA